MDKVITYKQYMRDHDALCKEYFDRTQDSTFHNLEFRRAASELHHAYFIQWDCKNIREAILSKWSITTLVNAYAQDRHLNNLPIKEWDRIGAPYQSYIAHKHGDINDTLPSCAPSDITCVLKSSAIAMILQENKHG